MNLKRFLSAILVALLVIAALPVASLAETINANATEARKLQLLDTAWNEIENVEAEAISKKASPAEVTAAAYKAALNSGYVDEGSLVMESDIQFAFTVDGMHCLYYYTARNAQRNVVEGEGETIVTDFSSKSGNCAGSPNVLLVGPYYSSDSSFTDQYKNEADSIGEATGGTVTKLVNANATGPAIAAAYTDKGVVIYDSHGTQSGTSSYLCLTTNSGITTTDYNNGWAVSSGSAAYIDGRYIQNHVSGTLSNPLVWMAICEGMKKAGNGTTGTALLAAGAAAVYGYSQSVTFKGDYEYEEVFWNEMKDGANMADALVTMKNQYGVPDPYGDAYPIVMSPVDAFPSNPDAAQTVNCDWTLFSQDPIALNSFEITDANGAALNNPAIAMGKRLNVKIAANPTNANTYTVAWASSNTSVATVAPSTNGKTAVVNGVNPGTATITATVTDNAKAVYTKSFNIIVTEAAQWVPVDTITPGDPYLIGFVANGTTYLAVNYNASASNPYYFTSSNYDYYGYTAPATFNGQNVIGVSGNADDLEYCTWIFSSANGGTIQSGYQSNYYLRTWTSTSYSDCYVDTTSQQWTYSNHQLYRTISNTNRYAQYINNSSTNGMCVGSSVPSGYSVQLYAEQAVVVDPTPTPDPTTAPDPTPTPEPTTQPEVTVYEHVDYPEVGGRYIITSGNYAVGNSIVSNNHYLNAQAVTINGNYCEVASTVDVNTILWLCEDGTASTGFSFKNAGNNKYMGFDAGQYLYPSDTALYWLQENVTSTGCDLNDQIDTDGYYYLALGSGSTYFTTSKNANGLINFYKEIVPVVEPTPTPEPDPTPTPEPTVAPTEPPVVEGPAVTYTGETVEVLNPVVGDTFYWTLNVSEASGMFSGHWLVDYAEQYFTASNYSVTWAGGIQAQVQASWDDEEATSDKPAFVCNPNYEGQTGGSPVGEAGNMYANVGMYLTSNSFMGLQMGGSMVRLTYQWTNIPAESMTIPVPVTVLESTYMTMDNGTMGYLPHTDVTVVDGEVIVTIAGEPHSVTYTGATVEQADPAVGDTFFWTLDVSEASGMFSGHWLVDYAEEYFTVSNYSVTWAGGIQSQIQASWDDEEAWSDKPAFVCNPNYEGQTGGAPAGEAGNMYSNVGMYLTSNSYMGVQMGGSMVRLTMQWTNVPTESMTIPVPVIVLESTYMSAMPSSYAPHEVVNVVDGAVIVTISAPEAPEVTYSGSIVEQVDPAIGDTFFWYLDVSEYSAMFSGHWLVDYAEEYFTVSNYSVTWAGGIQAQIQATWDDEEAWSDKPAFVCNANYEGQTGGAPAGEAGNMYSNCGMYLTSNSYGGVQMGGHMVRLTMQWTNVPTESMTIPVPVIVLESTYMVAAPSSYAPHEVVNVEDGAVIVTINQVNEYTVTFVDMDGTVIDTQTVVEGEAAVAPAAPVHEGYTFTGWDVDFSNVTGDMTVTATYVVNTYQLAIYYLKDTTGMAIASGYFANIAYGTEYSVTSPVITGWHLVDESQAVISGVMPAQNVEIDVYYTQDIYTITYYVDGVEVYSEEVAYGNAVTPYNYTAPEGYTFSGWDNVPATMPAQNVAVNGYTTVNEYTVTVHYVYEDGTPAADDAVITVAYGQPYAVVTPEIEGYEYDIAVVEGVMGTENIEATVTYTEIPVGTFVWGDADCDGDCDWSDVSALYLFLLGEGSLTEQGKINANVNNSNPFVDPADMSGIDDVCAWNDVTYISMFLLGELLDPSTIVTEYTLTINYVDAQGNVMAPAYTATLEEGSSYNVASPVIDGYMAIPSVVTGTLNEDTTVEVVYYPVSHQLRIYYLNEATGYALTGAYIANIAYGTEYSVTSPTINGYHLVDEAQAVIAGVMPNYDVEIDVYYAIDVYTVNYYLNGELYETVEYTYGTTPVAPAYTAPEGYTFSGWELGADGNYYGTTTVNQYTVSYRVQGGLYTTQTYNYGDAIVAPEAPAIEGYTFVEWENLPATMPAEDIFVNAVYTINSYNLTINYVDGEGNVVAPAYTAVVEYGAAYAVTSPVVDGYTTETTEVSGVMPAEDVEINVVYTAEVVPQGPAVTYYIDEISATTPSVDANTPWIYFCVSEASCMFSGHWLIDYDENFLAANGYSVTWSGGIQAQIQATWDDEEATSDKPAFVCNPEYEGQSGGSPVGEAGNMYANAGMYLTSNQYGGVQMGGPAIRLRYKWTAIPTAADCMQDANGYYLPIGIIVLESTYLESAPSNYQPHTNITTVDGRLYVNVG